MKKLMILVTGVMILLGCSSIDQHQATLHTSEQYYNYIQPSFDDYLAETESWLSQNRAFISEDKSAELEMNMPFQMGDPKSDKAALLVHGLGDSPFSFRDIAASLVSQGFYVQALLLPGHGSNPHHMELATYSDWQLLVDHYAGMLTQQYDEVWLGGFSTGGNLVTINAIDQSEDQREIAGLLLFSPGFQTLTPNLEKLTPIAALFTDGWWAEEDNLAKYSSAPISSALAYSESAKVLRNKLKGVELKIPTLMVAAEADSVIDAKALSNYFQQNFTHPRSQMVWYGSEELVADIEKVQTYNMVHPELKISTASHMSLLFAPENHYYGQYGEKIICENSFSESDREACKQGEPVWFSAWGYTESDKIHARLTWNPYYNELESILATITQ